MLQKDNNILGIIVKETVIQHIKNEIELGQEIKYESTGKNFEEALPAKEDIKIKASNFV